MTTHADPPSRLGGQQKQARLLILGIVELVDVLLPLLPRKPSNDNRTQ